MGIPREPKAAKYFVAVLLSDTELLTSVENDLSSALSEIDNRSDVMPWRASNFYEKEMGAGLLRRFLSLKALESPERLAAVKLKSVEIHPIGRTPAIVGRSIPYLINLGSGIPLHAGDKSSNGEHGKIIDPNSDIANPG